MIEPKQWPEISRRQGIIGLLAATGAVFVPDELKAVSAKAPRSQEAYLDRFDNTPDDRKWALVRSWIYNEPREFFAELRSHRPVLVMPEVTLVARYEDCQTVLRRHDAFTVELYKPKQGTYLMAQDDTAAHTREKAIMLAILDRDEVPAIRKYIADKAASILLQAKGHIDAVGDLGRAVPIALVQDWFGFTDSDPKELFEWSYWNQTDAFWNQGFDKIVVPDPGAITAKREAASLRMRDYLVNLVTRRADELKAGKSNTDVVSRLLRLSFSESVSFDVPSVVLNVGGLLVGAVETTSHAFVNALAGLMAEPNLMARAKASAVAADTTTFDGYVFEALRFKPAFPYFFRVCRLPTTLAGGTDHATEIPHGTTVLAVTHSAMFDPAAFAEPERFDPTRPVAASFHFGQGLHECLGRAIGQAMIPEIVRQCCLKYDLRAAGPIDYRGGPVPEAWHLQWGA
jgi:cytochrome P450